jgi:hypothetical protein
MSDFHEIWKWEDAEKRLEFARRYTQAGSDSGDGRMARVVEECDRWKRLYEAKQLELARLQKRVEELEKAK